MKKHSFVLLLVGLLAACAGADPAGPQAEEKAPQPRHCPQVAILRPLEKIQDFGGDTPDPSTLVATGFMKSFSGECDYTDEGVDIAFDLTLVAEKGPRLGGRSVSFPFFVTVVKPDETVARKELMTANFNFEGSAKVTTYEQPLRVFLPLAKGEDASAFRVLVGYQLTEEQRRQVQ